MTHPTARAERPILFSGPMVRAILAVRKTVTRRLVQRPNPDATGVERQVAAPTCIDLPPGAHFYRWLLRGGISAGFLCPYGQPGEHLWVRETFAPSYFDDGRPAFRADYDRARVGDVVPEPKWKPSIFMPRDMSRLVLEVVSVRVERLQDVTEEDAQAEGVEPTVSEWWTWWNDSTKITCDECNATKYRRSSTMTIRAKFVLQSVTTYGGEGRELSFWAQYDTTIPEDQRFAKATPSGSMKMVIDNPAALAFFEGKIGKAFYLDMVEAPEPPKS